MLPNEKEWVAYLESQKPKPRLVKLRIRYDNARPIPKQVADGPLIAIGRAGHDRRCLQRKPAGGKPSRKPRAGSTLERLESAVEINLARAPLGRVRVGRAMSRAGNRTRHDTVDARDMAFQVWRDDERCRRYTANKRLQE